MTKGSGNTLLLALVLRFVCACAPADKGSLEGHWWADYDDAAFGKMRDDLYFLPNGRYRMRAEHVQSGNTLAFSGTYDYTDNRLTLNVAEASTAQSGTNQKPSQTSAEEETRLRDGLSDTLKHLRLEWSDKDHFTLSLPGKVKHYARGT